MEVQVEKIESWKLALRVKSDPSIVEEEMEKLFNRYASGAEIPGFRRGKAPREMVKARFAETVRSEAIERAIPDVCRRAILEKGLNPITQAEIDEVSFKPGEELSFRATFEIVPDFEVRAYEGLEIRDRKVEPSSADTETRLELLRQMSASLIPVKREARAGDHLIVDYSIIGDDGQPLPDGSVSNYSLPLGESGQKELDEALRGAKPGDVSEVIVQFSAESGDKRVAGKRLPVRVKVKEVKEKRLPELGDEFAKDLGAENLKELRERVGKEMIEETKRMARAEWEREVVDGLIKMNSFDPPGSLVESYLEEMRERDPELAVWLARRAILLDKLAQVLGVSVLEEDLVARVKRIADDLRADAKKIRDSLEASGRIEQVMVSIKREKVLSYLIEHADRK